MSERDTLAALLHPMLCDSEHNDPVWKGVCETSADRLIAAGVRLAPADTGLREALAEVEREVSRAEAKHAPMHSPHEGHSVIREEVDELWDHVRADTGRSAEARKEAIQIAAMGVRYALNLCDALDAEGAKADGIAAPRQTASE